jgi:hypothetical protein
MTVVVQGAWEIRSAIIERVFSRSAIQTARPRNAARATTLDPVPSRTAAVAPSKVAFCLGVGVARAAEHIEAVRLER